MLRSLFVVDLRLNINEKKRKSERACIETTRGTGVELRNDFRTLFRTHLEDESRNVPDASRLSQL